VNATLASEALSVIGEKKNEINIVLVEAQFPDMEIYELVDKMKSSNFPSITKALHTGAKWCFRKPVQISDLRQLWRFAVWNRFEPTFSEEIFDKWLPLLEVIEENKISDANHS
jgi:DNA-binding response OmpR family regulator